MSKPSYGICKLTGNYGKFARSHIIPAALTKAADPSGLMLQHGPFRRAQKRRSSWYDARILTSEGEAILGRLDDWAIKFLRESKLVWSGFGPISRIEPDITFPRLPALGNDYGLRRITVEHPDKLRKFLLSLLWRAAVSTLDEMNEIALDDEAERRIRSLLVDGTSLPLEIFPCFLTQHHHVGFIHNQSPIRQIKHFPATKEHNAFSIEIYRFYFDGLVAHFHSYRPEEHPPIFNQELTVGYAKEVVVTCVPWEHSFQLENVTNIARESLW